MQRDIEREAETERKRYSHTYMHTQTEREKEKESVFCLMAALHKGNYFYTPNVYEEISWSLS